MNRRLCWNCKEWSVTPKDIVCENCGVANPYHEEEVSRVKADLEKLERLSRWDSEFSAGKFADNVAILFILSIWIIGIVGGAMYGSIKWGLLGLILGLFAGFWFSVFSSGMFEYFDIPCIVSTRLRDRRWRKHVQRIEILKKRLEKLTRPVLDRPIREEKREHTTKIAEITEEIRRLKARYAALPPADRTLKYREHESDIAKKESEIDIHRLNVWCADFTLWGNQYESFPMQRDNLSLQECGRRITELIGLRGRGVRLQQDWCEAWNSFDTNTRFDALKNSLDFCQREIDELQVQREAILVADKTEQYKPLIADPYNIKAVECDRRAEALEEAIRWGEAQQSRYNSANFMDLPGMKHLADELGKVLQDYQEAIDELKRVAYEIERSQKGTKLPGDILAMLSARQARILQNVNARKEAIRELASPTATEAQLERIRQQRIEFQSRQELDRFVNTVAVVKTPAEETARQSQGNILS